MASPPSQPLPEPPLPLTGADQETVRRCLGVLAILGTGSLIGVASSLYLLNAYPLLLVALSPIGRHLVLVAPVVDPLAFVALVVGRRMLFYLPCFQLGRTLGPRAIPWIEQRVARLAPLVRWLERLFARASHVVVFGMAGPTVSVLAGVSGMRWRVFLGLAACGLALRALLLLYFAEWLEAPLLALRAWIAEYWIPGTVAIVAAIAWRRWRLNRRRAPS